MEYNVRQMSTPSFSARSSILLRKFRHFCAKRVTRYNVNLSLNGIFKSAGTRGITMYVLFLEYFHGCWTPSRGAKSGEHGGQATYPLLDIAFPGNDLPTSTTDEYSKYEPMLRLVKTTRVDELCDGDEFPER